MRAAEFITETFNQPYATVAEGFPNFNREWDEATRYPEFVNLGKKKWIELVSKGKPVTVTRKNVNKINNTDAADPNSFKLLDPEKQKRALAQLAHGDVEMPIVARYSDGYLELIGGNTRLTAQMAKDGQAKVWLFNVPEELTQGVAEATGDEKFDTMMSRIAAEPKVADMNSNMPPTSIPELLQWANKNNKPYHRKFAEWARNHNFTNVNAALEWFGDNVDPWDEFGSKEYENVFGDLVGEPLIDAAKHDPKAAELLKVYVSYEKIFDDWTDKYRQMNYPDRFGNFNEQGVAEGRENYNGVNILFQKDDDEIFVKASAGGRELGHVLFVVDGDYLMPQDLEVEERFRGQGIAQTMYDYVKSKGYKIRRSGQQTDAGAGFWGKHRPEQNVWEDAGTKINFTVQKSGNKFATTMTVNGEPAGVYQYNADTGRSVAEVYPEYRGKGLGKVLVLHAIYTAAQLGLDFQEDESRTSEYDNVLDSLSNNGYIVDDNGYWYVTGEGEQFLKQSLKQGVAEDSEHDYLSQIPNLSWKPISRRIWNTIQDEGLDEEQNAPDYTDWLMASLSISPKDAQALQAFDNDAIEDFNRFDIHLKSRYPGLTDLIDYDRGTVTIVKTAREQDMAENFADGKVKGKSRPGRVKRAGASCDGSVTSLRQRAKNASGERAKMYHWCANMKSGKKK